MTIKSDVGIRALIQPVETKNRQSMLGIWVRDDSQGIGSLSFICGEKYYALGHGISDIDTGKLLSSHEGTIYNANIWGVKKGKKALCGTIKYNKENVINSILSNNTSGINGIINEPKIMGIQYQKNGSGTEW